MASQAVNGFRLSPKQEHLWALERGMEETPFVAQCVLFVDGPLDSAALKECLLTIVERHEILRTNFSQWTELNIPIQTISAPQISWAHSDLQGLSPADQVVELQRLSDTSRHARFDLQREPVLRAHLVQLSFSEHHLILTLPALCADGRSLNNLAQEISDAYHLALRDDEVTGEALQYADVSQWYYDALEADDAQIGKEYWRSQFVTGAEGEMLPFQRRSANDGPFSPEVLVIEIPADLAEKIETFARQQEFSPSALLLSCWQILLWRLTSQSPLQLGVACDGRGYPELEAVLGLLTAHVPMLTTVEANSSFVDNLARTASHMDEASQWQDCFTWAGMPAEKVDQSRPYFPLCFEFIERPQTLSSTGARFSLHRHYACIDRFDLKLSCVRTDHSLVTEFHYDTSQFGLAGVQLLARRFRVLIASALDEPNRAVANLEIMDEREQETLAAFNSTAEAFPHDLCFHQLFERQVERFPDAPAVCIGEQQLTYAELNAKASQLAHRLVANGIGPENLVGICLERSPLMMIALLGIVKAGAAYLPLDPQTPANRLRFIVQDAEVSAVITQAKFRELLPNEAKVPAWCLDTGWPLIADTRYTPPRPAQPENIAYVIYTSGSTGTPKGVMISHRSLMNYLTWAQQAYRIDSQSRTLVHSPFAFDLTITGLLLPLIAGGKVELVKPGDELQSLCDALGDTGEHYSLIKLTPSHLQVLSSWLGEADRCGRVDALIVGGEALPGNLLDVWQQRSTQTRLINEYGPTETVVGCSTYEVPAGAGKGSIPIGRPISNMQLYVLDESMRVVPTESIGEIYIGGEGVARGYLKQPELTAERFIPDPFSTQVGKRLYRSGDLGRINVDGQLEYLGRTDEQVKIKGFRVELGEIETVLLNHPMVRESAVVLGGNDGEKRLLGYVVLQNANWEGNERTRVEEIRAYLKRELPEYMVPSELIVLERMRLTNNGKVNRNALPLPTREVYEDDDGHATQFGPVEQILISTWREILNLRHIDVTDNFFSLGGDSIMAVEVAFRAKSKGLTIHPVQLFRYPTIAELAGNLSAPAQDFVEERQKGEAVTNPESPAKSTPMDFPLAKLNQEKLDHILRKLSK